MQWTCAGSALLYKNGVIEESGVAWLGNRLAPWGEHLEAGEIVLGGSFTRPVQAATGGSFHADYGPLGAISFRMV